MIVFLIYLNRSGSTLLSRELDAFKEIGVTPEAKFPDGICYREQKIDKKEDIGKYLNKLYSNHKFRSWNVDRKLLAEKFQSLTLPARFEDIFRLALEEYFKKDPAEVYIYKSPYIWYIFEIKKRFPQARFILVKRDIRAIHNSKRKTLDTDYNKPMINNPFIEVVYYKKFLKVLNKYSNTRWMHIVDYENLIAWRENEINKILDFLEVTTKNRYESTHYFNKLSDDQKNIHGNLNQEMLDNRIHAWKDELDRPSIWIFQKFLKKELARQNYPFTSAKLKVWDIGPMVIYLFNFIWEYSKMLILGLPKKKYKI